MKRSACFLLFAVAVMVLCPRPVLAEEGSELINILVQKEPNRLAVTLQTARPVVFESYTLVDPNRLIIDLQNTTHFETEPLIAVMHLGIQSIRTAQNRPDVVRVVFDFPSAVPPYSISDTPEGIVVTFLERERDPVEPATPVKEEEPVSKPPKSEPAVSAPQPPDPKDKPAPAPVSVSQNRWLAAGMQTGLYFIQDENFKDFYGTSALSFGIEGIYFFPISDREAVGIGLDVKVINAEGEMSFLQDKIELRLLPFTLSAAYLRKFGRVMPFVSLGAGFLSYRETYPQGFVISSISGSAFGPNIQLGAYAAVSDNIVFKTFWKLHSIRTEISEGLTVDFGGHEIGVSACYRFNFKNVF